MHDPWWLALEVRSRHEEALRRAEQERLLRLARDQTNPLAGARPLHHRTASWVGAWLVALGCALQGRFSEPEPDPDTETAQTT